MARLNKNQVALEANQQALEKAKADLAKAQKAVTTLSQKIPELERACEALRVLCGEKKTHLPEKEVQSIRDKNIPDEVFKSTPSIPPDIASKLPVQDLTGFGSIPATKPPANEPELVVDPDDENAFLPPITGEPVL